MTPDSNLPEALQQHIYSVSELSQLLRACVENTFSHIRIKAELSGVKMHSSGHLYFTLKDQDAVMDAVCWRGTSSKLPLKPEDGIEVICTGRLTIYAGRSKYQMIVESMELSGEGTLLKLLEERKKKLAAEGFFALERKKPLPFLPNLIGIITSPTGAVIKDMLHRLGDRFPRHVILWPVAVQGDGAETQIVQAIQGFNRFAQMNLPVPDLLIVARGGGSLEDLWTFNEESIARAVANSQIPIISAVGHETDTTLIDFVSDFRAPTPTAAAERAVPVRSDLRQGLTLLENRLIRCLRSMTDERTQRLNDRLDRLRQSMQTLVQTKGFQLQRLSLRSPQELIQRLQERLFFITSKHHSMSDNFIKHLRQKFHNLDNLLESYSYQKNLERGFCLVQSAAMSYVKSAGSLKKNDLIHLTFHDGQKDALITTPGTTSQKKTAKPTSPQTGFWG